MLTKEEKKILDSIKDIAAAKQFIKNKEYKQLTAKEKQKRLREKEKEIERKQKEKEKEFKIKEIKASLVKKYIDVIELCEIPFILKEDVAYTFYINYNSKLSLNNAPTRNYGYNFLNKRDNNSLFKNRPDVYERAMLINNKLKDIRKDICFITASNMNRKFVEREIKQLAVIEYHKNKKKKLQQENQIKK